MWLRATLLEPILPDKRPIFEADRLGRRFPLRATPDRAHLEGMSALGRRILISHDASHSAFAKRLVRALRGVGEDACIENLRVIRAGQSFECFQAELGSRFDHVVPLLSEPYLQDEFLIDELWAAAVLDERKKSQFLLPAVISDCKLPLPTFLRQRVTNFCNVRFEAAFQHLRGRLARCPRVFVMMRVGQTQADTLYKEGISTANQDLGFPQQQETPQRRRNDHIHSIVRSSNKPIRWR